MALTEDLAVILDRMSPETQKAGLGSEILRLAQLAELIGATPSVPVASAEGGQVPCFVRTVVVSPAEAQAPGGAVLVEPEEVPAGKRIHLLWFMAGLLEAGVWAQGGYEPVVIAGSGPEGQVLVELAADMLGYERMLCPASLEVGVRASFLGNAGLGAGEGLVVQASGQGLTGPDAVFTVFGYFGPASS